MNFFREESKREIKDFVNKHVGGTNIDKMIREFAGCDEDGEVLNKIVLKIEGHYGEDHFENGYTAKTFPGHLGTICGDSVHLWFYAHKDFHRQHYANGDPVFCRIATAVGKNESVESSAIIFETIVADWNPKTRRRAIVKGIRILYKNRRCKCCDCLVVKGDKCEKCSLTINTHQCCFCKSRVGNMTHKPLKRGGPYTHYHAGCFRRQKR